MAWIAGLRETTRGILWALLGTFLFTFVFASGKLLGGEVAALQILFLRYVSGFATVLTLAARSRIGLAAHISRRPQWHVARAVCGAFGGVCAIHAATVMPVADATAIGLTEGVLIMLLAIVFLGERVSTPHWIAAALSALGALIVVRGGAGPAEATGAFGEGALFAFLGAVLIAAESILIKVLAKRESPRAVILHVNFFGMLLLAGPALWVWTPPAAWQLALCVGLGPLAITAQYCWIRSYRHADAALVAPIGYTWIVFAALLGLLLFGELPTRATAVGSLLICAGGVMLTRLPEARRGRTADQEGCG